MGAASIHKIDGRPRMWAWHDQVAIASDEPAGPTVSVIFFICDDCGEAYMGPVYYTFPQEACHVDDDDQSHPGCTENLCPDCAGPYLEPNEEDDPRRPTA